MERTEAELHGGNAVSRNTASRKRRSLSRLMATAGTRWEHANNLLDCVDQTHAAYNVSTTATSS